MSESTRGHFLHACGGTWSSSSHLGRLSSDYYPFEGWSRCSCYHVWYTISREISYGRGCTPCLLPSDIPRELQMFRHLPSTAIPLSPLSLFVSYSSFVSFETMRCHFSPWIWKFHISHAAPFRWGDTRISLFLEIMQFLGRLIAFAVPATFDISPWLFHRYGDLLSVDGLCKEEDSLC